MFPDEQSCSSFRSTGILTKSQAVLLKWAPEHAYQGFDEAAPSETYWSSISCTSGGGEVLIEGSESAMESEIEWPRPEVAHSRLIEKVKKGNSH
jgi:hypothetical protein